MYIYNSTRDKLGHRLVVSLDNPLGLLRVKKVVEPAMLRMTLIMWGPDQRQPTCWSSTLSPILKVARHAWVPHLAALVPAGGEKLLAGPVPGQTVDATRVS